MRLSSLSLHPIMSPSLCAQLVFAALVLSGSALTPEECRPLLTPRSLADPSVLHGKMHFLAGYVEHDVYKAILKVTDSSWVNITASPSGRAELLLSQGNKMNGVCMTSLANVTIEGDMMRASMLNVSSTCFLLPSCAGCYVWSMNSTATNLSPILKAMKLDIVAPEEIQTRALYLLGTESTLKDSDLEQFKQQAGCMGFTGEPDFVYNPEKSYCKEGEGVLIRGA